jgi:hypothetical protein
MLNYLHFKTLYSKRQNVDALFLITVFRTQLTAVPLWMLLVSVRPLNKLGSFLPATSVMPQDLALQQGASQLQTASADLRTFSVNIPSPLRIHFTLLNPTELRH